MKKLRNQTFGHFNKHKWSNVWSGSTLQASLGSSKETTLERAAF